jgi:transcriptional regulator with XRE-family HTH domain
MWIDRVIGERIRVRCDEQAVSVSALGERTGIDEFILQAYETGKKRIQRRDLLKIARALDMSVECLLDGADTSQRRFPRVSSTRDTVRISHS